MSQSSVEKHHRTGSLYGAFAYGSVVLTCYAGFFAGQRYYTSEWMVPVVFALGALYVALGILGAGYQECAGRVRQLPGYFWVQCTLLTAIVLLSPSRGFMGIVVLPVMSQAVFDLRPRTATLIGLYLFGLNIAIWGVPFGWEAALQALVNYSAGFAFTIAFTLVTKRALLAREREQKLREEVEAANRQLREQAAQREELATTRERNRVAREIHDGVGHYLTVVKTQLDAAVALMPTQPDKAKEIVTKAAKLAGDALDDVRSSVGELRTDVARAPLPEALRALTQEAGLPVTVRVEGAARALAPGIEHALFRSAQEGLTNIRKHAAASAAEVALDFRATGKVLLAVTDNGRGAGAAAGPGAPGFGLKGIRERIEVLGGRVESGNRSDGGFALTIEVPA
ncbi:MAG: histidine kinase [Verrucomicrobia bacterium]|nr:histidine kinase [Verrucomicrobiota bacterium]